MRVQVMSGQDGGGSLTLSEIKPALKILQAAAKASQGAQESQERTVSRYRKVAKKKQVMLAMMTASDARQKLEAEAAERRRNASAQASSPAACPSGGSTSVDAQASDQKSAESDLGGGARDNRDNIIKMGQAATMEEPLPPRAAAVDAAGGAATGRRGSVGALDTAGGAATGRRGSVGAVGVDAAGGASRPSVHAR